MLGSTFLGGFYIFLTVLLLVLAFIEKDDWYKFFHVLGAITIIALMMSMAVFQTAIDNDYPLQVEKTSGANLDINSLSEVSQESISDTDEYHLQTFNSFNEKHLGLYDKANFCFNYNASDDGDNVVRVSSTVTTISDYVYLKNDTSGTVCTEINTTLLHQGINLGVFCEDCSPSNVVNLQRYSGLSGEIHVNKTDPLNYEILNEQPHNFYIEGFFKPVRLINDNFNWFLFFLGVYSMFYLMRFLFNYIKEGTKY